MVNKEKTVGNIAHEMIDIMRDRIGEGNSIKKSELFEALYDKELSNSDSDFYRIILMKRAIAYLRRNSDCFIIFKDGVHEKEYFVPKSMSETKDYIKCLDKLSSNLEVAKNNLKKYIKKKGFLAF